MAWQSLLSNLLPQYGNLPGNTALDAIERAIARALSRTFGVPFAVRLNNKLEIWKVPPDGEIEEFTERRFSTRMRRYILFEIENELRAAQVVLESDKLLSLKGKVVTGIVKRTDTKGNVLVEMELVDLFERYILMGECPPRFQPPHERRRYLPGETRTWYVTSVKPVAGRNNARVLVQLSRIARHLPAILLTGQSGIDRITCLRRLPGNESHLVADQRISKEAIAAVKQELKEDVRVQVLS
jgi:hypothetical protein